MSSTTTPRTAASRLRALLADSSKILVCPGVYDGLTARIALREGFDCLYMTGAGTAASRLGCPDLGVVTLNDKLANATMLASLDCRVPLIADADTGYGGPIMIARTVRAYMAARVAGLHLEDQVLNKRCGHLAGKQLVDEDEYLSRIRAAVLAREEVRQTTGGDIVLIAQTDALQSYGYDVAVERLRRAVEIGMDVAFLEGVTSVEIGRRVCAELASTPVLLNMVPGGVTPVMTAEVARRAGFRVMVHPGLALSAVYQSVTAVCAELKSKGEVKFSEKQLREGVKGVFNVCGLEECIEFDQKAGGTSF